MSNILQYKNGAQNIAQPPKFLLNILHLIGKKFRNIWPRASHEGHLPYLSRIGGRLHVRLDAATLGRMLSGLGDPFGDG